MLRLTKPILWCKASIVLLALSLACAAAADPYPAPPGNTLRDCITQAGNSEAVAICEKQEQAALKARIEQLSVAIRARLDPPRRLIFDRSANAWQAFFEHENAMLELSLALRKDGLAPRLRPGAVTLLYEQRAKQLREHLHNLSLAPSAGAGTVR